MKPNCILLAVALSFWCVLAIATPVPAVAEQKPQGKLSIQVEPIQAEEGELPPDFRIAIYENLITQLERTRKFRQVYRSGDHQAESATELLVLKTTLKKFQRGNQTTRSVTTVAGATKVAVHLNVATRDGRVLVDRDVQGTVRLFGENLKATHNLAKDIAGILRETSLSVPEKAAGQ
jgi:hypothetical protein